MTIFLALCSALAYGAADFFGGLATRRAAIFNVVVPVQAVGLAAFACAMPFLHGQLDEAVILSGLAGGVCAGAGLALLYQALAIGQMGVVSPITAVLAAALPVAAGTLRGEHLDVAQAAGIAFALAAVVLLSATTSAPGAFERRGSGIKEALASGVLLGGFYIFLGFAPKHGGAYTLLFARAASTALLAFTGLAFRKAIVPPRGVRALTLCGGVLDMGANVLYILAVHSGLLAIAAVLTSLYPASTILMARIVLRERLRPWQIAGIVVALAGVALIAA